MVKRPDVLRGAPFVKFLCKRVNEKGVTFFDTMLMNLDSTTGTHYHIMRYSRKPGWRILDFGNLHLDPEAKGAFAESVEEHTQIYYSCKKELGLAAETSALKAAYEKRIEALETASTEKVLNLEAKIAALEAQLLKDAETKAQHYGGKHEQIGKK